MPIRNYPAQPLIWVRWKQYKHPDHGPNASFRLSELHLVTKDHKRTTPCLGKIGVDAERKHINDIPPGACKKCAAIAKVIMIANLQRRLPPSIVKAAMAQ